MSNEDQRRYARFMVFLLVICICEAAVIVALMARR